MSPWRFEDLDPPEARSKRVVDPMERVAVVISAVIVIGVAVSAIGERVAPATETATLPIAAATPTATPSPQPYTFVMRATGMASAGYWCTTADAPATAPSRPPDRLIVIVSSDRSQGDSPIACAIPTGAPHRASSPRRK